MISALKPTHKSTLLIAVALAALLLCISGCQPAEPAPTPTATPADTATSLPASATPVPTEAKLPPTPTTEVAFENECYYNAESPKLTFDLPDGTLAYDVSPSGDFVLFYLGEELALFSSDGILLKSNEVPGHYYAYYNACDPLVEWIWDESTLLVIGDEISLWPLEGEEGIQDPIYMYSEIAKSPDGTKMAFYTGPLDECKGEGIEKECQTIGKVIIIDLLDRSVSPSEFVLYELAWAGVSGMGWPQQNLITYGFFSGGGELRDYYSPDSGELIFSYYRMDSFGNPEIPIVSPNWILVDNTQGGDGLGHYELINLETLVHYPLANGYEYLFDFLGWSSESQSFYLVRQPMTERYLEFMSMYNPIDYLDSKKVDEETAEILTYVKNDWLANYWQKIQSSNPEYGVLKLDPETRRFTFVIPDAVFAGTNENVNAIFAVTPDGIGGLQAALYDADGKQVTDFVPYAEEMLYEPFCCWDLESWSVSPSGRYAVFVGSSSNYWLLEVGETPIELSGATKDDFTWQYNEDVTWLEDRGLVLISGSGSFPLE